ncbi:D-alanyl-D-alanine carboxypeptidase/D-alanyl-D-alanine-endopeptidase [Mucilaginibacter jinjuensis]|uniref:D-alanyl-D-alanine carboxypeptidase n=1 Tax=Mucilaginibacter jinjuensis TaxID=1176721 RepID=A0ABY7T793_9SPHI|nr:D-alanyl-D-alanine carboxypeptidase [Mucilaginibacter jinjuensis]WCT12227.1 D-alanyl-D-alanine carboxypeptidase [Mucilaginibacter jinjuensis]
MPRYLLKWLAVALFICLALNVCQAGKIRTRKIKKLFKHSVIFNTHFTGFALYDIDKQQTVYELNADHYFTPASNTKLFTFYTCLKMLSDSVPALKYSIRNDSLLFWGTGDPSFLHTELKGTNAYNFLKQSDKKLFFCLGQYQNNIYGTGWAWDDYNDYYNAEINELPVYDNLVTIYADTNKQLQTIPAYFSRFLTTDSSYRPTNYRLNRNFLSNEIISPSTPAPTHFKQEIPWKTSNELIAQLLQDTLKKTVGILNINLPPNAKVIYNINTDTVYRHMLQASDNFMAEQLLLSCSSVKFSYLNTDSVRQYAIRNYLNDLPDKPQWADGSGLSRLNLFTPRSIIVLLNKIRGQVNNDDLLHSMLSAGGVSGTLRNAYKTDNGQPFVWGKTGSLSNNYNQSGYLITRKGHRLAYCFMNNNYVDSTRSVRDEMARVITYIHDNF